jgi:hypothetical protein
MRAAGVTVIDPNAAGTSLSGAPTAPTVVTIPGPTQPSTQPASVAPQPTQPTK